MKHFMSNYELLDLCVRNNWFTAGSIKQYEKLFDRNNEGASIEELSIIIWICSSNASKDEIYTKLFETICNKTST